MHHSNEYFHPIRIKKRRKKNPELIFTHSGVHRQIVATVNLLTHPHKKVVTDPLNRKLSAVFYLTKTGEEYVDAGFVQLLTKVDVTPEPLWTKAPDEQ